MNYPSMFLRTAFNLTLRFSGGGLGERILGLPGVRLVKLSGWARPRRTGLPGGSLLDGVLKNPI